MLIYCLLWARELWSVLHLLSLLFLSSILWRKCSHLTDGERKATEFSLTAQVHRECCVRMDIAAEITPWLQGHEHCPLLLQKGHFQQHLWFERSLEPSLKVPRLLFNSFCSCPTHNDWRTTLNRHPNGETPHLPFSGHNICLMIQMLLQTA